MAIEQCLINKKGGIQWPMENYGFLMFESKAEKNRVLKKGFVCISFKGIRAKIYLNEFEQKLTLKQRLMRAKKIFDDRKKFKNLDDNNRENTPRENGSASRYNTLLVQGIEPLEGGSDYGTLQAPGAQLNGKSTELRFRGGQSGQKEGITNNQEMLGARVQGEETTKNSSHSSSIQIFREEEGQRVEQNLSKKIHQNQDEVKDQNERFLSKERVQRGELGGRFAYHQFLDRPKARTNYPAQWRQGDLDPCYTNQLNGFYQFIDKSPGHPTPQIELQKKKQSYQGQTKFDPKLDAKDLRQPQNLPEGHFDVRLNAWPREKIHKNLTKNRKFYYEQNRTTVADKKRSQLSSEAFNREFSRGCSNKNLKIHKNTFQAGPLYTQPTQEAPHHSHHRGFKSKSSQAIYPQNHPHKCFINHQGPNEPIWRPRLERPLDYSHEQERGLDHSKYNLVLNL